jgi:hypothetical protein
MLIARFKILLFFMIVLTLTACTHDKKIYTSDCNDGRDFKRISLANLADSLEFYNNKFVEVTGLYRQDKAISLLIGDKNKNAILVEFSNACPLFLTGTRIGFFDYDNNNGQLTPVNNKTIILKGEIMYHANQKLNAPKASINHISYVQL